MSGGYFEYFQEYQIEETARLVSDKEIRNLILDLKDVLHAEDYYQSGDTCEKTYKEALRKFKTKWFKGDRSERLKSYIDEEVEQVRSDLYELIGADSTIDQVMAREG